MFSPYCAVPAFQGAINNAEHNSLWLIFQQNACSLPPEPRIRIFKMNFILCYSKNEIAS